MPTIGGWRCAQYDGIVAIGGCEHFGRGRGVNSMMVALLVAGIGLLLAGLVGDRVRNSDQRIQLRQYAAHRRDGCGLHRDAAARPLDSSGLKNIARRLGPGACRPRVRRCRRSRRRPAPRRVIAANPISICRDQCRAAAVRNRLRSARAHRRHGLRGRPRDARRTIAACTRRRSSPRRPPSRSATCCFRPHPARNASAPRRGRRAFHAPILLPNRWPPRRLPNHARRRQPPSTTPGRNRNARGPMFRRRVAPAGRRRPSPKDPAAAARIPLRRPRDRRSRRR